jgi:hypothetical protein
MVHRLVLVPFFHQCFCGSAGSRNFGPDPLPLDFARDRIGSAEVLAGFEELRDYITTYRPREKAFERPARRKERASCSFA